MKKISLGPSAAASPLLVTCTRAGCAPCGAAALAGPFAAVHIRAGVEKKGSEGSKFGEIISAWVASEMIRFGLPTRTTVFLASDLKHGIRDDRVASFVRAFPRTVDLAGLNLTQTAEWASLTGDDGGMTKGFASMILDQAICCLADLGFFSTALQVAKPPHTGKILRASTFSKLIHRTWERWHKRTMP